MEFKLKDVERLTGIKRTLLQQWQNLGYIDPPSIHEGRKQGDAHIYSLYDIINMLVFKKLVALGWRRKAAAKIVRGGLN